MKALIALTSIVGFLMVVLSGPLYQYAGVSLGTAMMSLQFGVYVGGTALILIILQVLLNRKKVSWGSTFICAVLALVAVGIPVSLMSKASTFPPIHDITTDVTNPPEFVATAPRREGAPNSIVYEGGEVTRQQLEAYPEIKTYLLPQPMNEVYIAAEKAIEALEWERASQGERLNTLEATVTTSWFGFKDDVVIRLTAKSDDTLVDVRSKSRVGTTDLGRNAERITTFVAELKNQLGYH